MSLPEKDAVRLRHMRDAAAQALDFCKGRVRADVLWASVNDKLPGLVQRLNDALADG